MSLAGTLGAPSPCQGPLATPCVTWVPQSQWTSLVPRGHPRIPVSVQVPQGPPDTQCLDRVPWSSHGHPLSPVSTPGTPGSLPGSHGLPMSLADTPRSPCPPGTPESRGYPTPMPPLHPTSLQGLQGSQSPTSPSAPRGSGRCHRGGSALGWAIRGAPRALPPALPHSPAGSGRRRRDPTGGPGGNPSVRLPPIPCTRPAPGGREHPGTPTPSTCRAPEWARGVPTPGFVGSRVGAAVLRCWGRSPELRVLRAGGTQASSPFPIPPTLRGSPLPAPPKHEGGLLGGARGARGAGDHPMHHG
ncbi:collagen alpha-3(IV) chain-like [Corvus moneduloides]|uniref:collagen alpha-3(IV) chain-like n=1 Tax=Corvus moneduloides TaxID=1196302 RepID=UPI00136473E9|nr:collagen alpha-3(IV) chain-like [Corvus moneduloides]